jgi:diadenosine tetraphosphate (Ap4A) HIT family hydrolase
MHTEGRDAVSSCFFCRLVAGLEKSWIVWEDASHVAFLTPFPNTPGFTVLVPRRHRPSHLFELEEAEFGALLQAGRRVGLLLDRALGTRRTALLAEGMGVDHVHLKLAPLHGLADGPWQPVRSTLRTFYERYQGYVASHDGPRLPEAELDALAEQIRKAASEL